MNAVYITKYAQTDGVFLREVERIDCDGYVWVKWPGGLNGTAMFKMGKDAHETLNEACEAFEKMRKAAILSAEKKISKLRALTFSVKE